MSAPPLFAVREATFRYGEVVAVDRLNLTIEAGQRIAFLGANGSGKSTVLRMLDGLCYPSSGSVEYLGYPLTEDHFGDDSFAFGFRRRVALVFQNPDVQLFCPTVFEEVAFGPLQMRWTRQQVRERVEQTLELLGIAGLRDRAPHHLSGGEKKKVAIATVLVLDPEVMLLDEPTAALDPRSQTQIIEFLSTWGATAKTIVTATHDLRTLEDIADECAIFERGRITARGTPHEILHNEELLRRANLIHSHRRGHSHVPDDHLHPDSRN